MARGLLPIAGNFDRRIAAPMDDMRVATKADLILPATWTAGDGVVYTWKGMVAVVYDDPTEENNGIYRLKSADYTQEGNWEKAGAGATVDLNAIDTQLATATATETATDTTILYVIGKAKITALKLYNYINEKLSTVFLKVSEYTGTGTKSVNRAVSSQYAGQANADILGRTIHETYALKQSGVTPPETARVILDDVTPTYSIVALTAENLIVENNATTDGEIIAPVLAADKTLKISIIGNDTLLDGTSYADGVTIFAIYEASTETWTFTSILDPEVPDYSDMTVDIMLENPTVITNMNNGIVVAQFIHINKTVFIRTHTTAIGIYQCVGLYSGNAYLQLIAAGTALHTVRVKDGDVWYSQYDGKNATSLIFKSGALWTKEIIPLVCSDEISDIAASTTVPKIRFVFPASFSVISIFAEMNVAPVGGTFTIDIKKNGTSVFSTLMTFDSGEASTRTASTPYVLTAPLSFVLGDYIEVFVTLAGTVTPGKGLKVYLLTTKIA